jgi:hypothetical protein
MLEKSDRQYYSLYYNDMTGFNLAGSAMVRLEEGLNEISKSFQRFGCLSVL